MYLCTRLIVEVTIIISNKEVISMKNEEIWMKFRNEFIKNNKISITLKKNSKKYKYLTLAGTNDININEKGISRNIWPN